MPAKKYFTEEEKRQARLDAVRKYRKNNPEKNKEHSEKARIKHIDKIKAYQKQYNSKNKEIKSLYNKQYCIENKEKVKAIKSIWERNNPILRKDSRKRYYIKNKEKVKSKNKAWRDSNKSITNIIAKNWRSKNIEKVKRYRMKYAKSENGRIASLLGAHRRLNQKKFIAMDIISKSELQNVYSKFKNQCYICKSKKRLCVDHHYPLSKGFALTINNAVLLCNSCNSSKNNKLPESFYSPEQLTDLQLNYGITKSPLKEEQPSLFEARMPKNLELDNGKVQAMNAA